MQPQPEFNSYSNISSSSSTNSKNRTATGKNINKQQQEHKHISEASGIASNLRKQQEKQKLLPGTKAQNQQTTILRPRVIKSKQPLLNFRFYLDIHDYQATRYIEKQIKLLGGKQEFFLDAPNITHFITDKEQLPANVLNQNNSNNTILPGTPPAQAHTPATPPTPIKQLEFKNASNYKDIVQKVAQTRANAILSRARKQGAAAAAGETAGVAISSPNIKTVNTAISRINEKEHLAYIVWQTEYALRFFKKVQHELKAYLQPENKITLAQREHLKGSYTASDISKNIASAGTDLITFKGGYIKIESIKRNCRPYHQVFRAPFVDWPKISLNSEDGAFCLTADHPLTMTRKSRSRSSQCGTALQVTVPPIRKVVNNTTKVTPSQTKTTTATTTTTTTPLNTTKTQSQCLQYKDSSEKQCGVCEICKIEYETLAIHLKTNDHEYFAKNSQNFIALDTLIQSSADVNKFLEEEVENSNNSSSIHKVNNNNNIMEMEVEVDGEDGKVLTHLEIDTPDPLDQPVESNNLSPPLRERSKRTTKGKHSSEKFQYKRTTNNNNNKTTIGGMAKVKVNAIKTPPKTLDTTTPTKNSKCNANKCKKSNTNANLSSPVRPFPPPSSLYKVVESSQIQTTPRRCGIERANENVTASPSIIVKFKKVRSTELFRLNGEAESFICPKQGHEERRISSDLPTDIDRYSSSDRLRTSINSSSSLDSSSISDIVVHMESPESIQTTRAHLTRNNHIRKQSFQSAPIQPDLTIKSLRKSSTTSTTPIVAKTVTPNKNDNIIIEDLSPPSAAAAIVAATAKITLPAATRKSSRMATAIVSAATTSSRLLRAAAEVVKKSGKCAKANTNINSKTVLNTTPLEKMEITNINNAQNLDISKTRDITPNNRIRRCRLVANATVVKMEDGMGDSSVTNTEDEIDIENADYVAATATVDVSHSRKRRRKTVNNSVVTAESNDNDDEEDDEDDIDNDDKADKDFKYKLKKTTKINTIPRIRRNKLKVANSIDSNNITTATLKNQTKINSNSNRKISKSKVVTSKSPTKAQKKVNKSTLYYDYTKSDRIKQHNYAFERAPTSDLWYRVFTRQDNCEERYFEYFGNTQYHKLPYELGPIPFFHTQIGANCCKLCHSQQNEKNVNGQWHVKKDACIKEEKANELSGKAIIDKELQTVIVEEAIKTKPETISEATSGSGVVKATSSTTHYALKHKKLHLLQRYRQDQEALKEQEKLSEQQARLVNQENCLMKAENLSNEVSNSIQCDMERLERSGSTHSTSSSCASNSTMNHVKKMAFRNKLLNKATFLNLELPPRKSPREHASTLALVSIIKQRQESKPNSDAEEALTVISTPTPKEEAQTTVTRNASSLPAIGHNSRAGAVTPIEKMCFATEISENVKRMRRGRNKYDHSPPYVLNNNTRRLARQKLNNRTVIVDKNPKTPEVPAVVEIEKQPVVESSLPPNTQDNKHDILMHKFQQKRVNSTGNLHSKVLNLPPSVRKTGQKKGVLEFSVDESALKTLEAALKPAVNVCQLEREIDEFLMCTGKELDRDDLLIFDNEEVKAKVTNGQEKGENQNQEELAVNTPPATDYFSSDFDLCDLLEEAENTILGGEEAKKRSRESRHISLYNTMALNSYFRKRKYMKTNRTGWPKLQKKKYSMRNQKDIGKELAKSEVSGKTAITPPDSEGDLLHIKLENDEHKPKSIEDKKDEIKDITDIDKKNEQLKQIEEIDGDNCDYGTDSILQEEDSVLEDEEEDDENKPVVATDQQEEYEKAVEADDEDEFNDAVDSDIPENPLINKLAKNHNNHNHNNDNDNNDDADADADGDDNSNDEHQFINHVSEEEKDEFEVKRKHSKRNSSLRQAFVNCLNNSQKLNVIAEGQNMEDEDDDDMHSMTATTSTPTTQLARALQRTPQLNGSLLSCNSPSERAGDNSDIFTVSSDGLDTDMDLSNPHPLPKHDEQQSQAQAQAQKHNSRNCSSKTNKYDITKYVKNPAANTCAAEAATAAVKSLAIAQFLKKEVRVTCRRIRAPFRRFRYRR